MQVLEAIMIVLCLKIWDRLSQVSPKNQKQIMIYHKKVLMIILIHLELWHGLSGKHLRNLKRKKMLLSQKNLDLMIILTHLVQWHFSFGRHPKN